MKARRPKAKEADIGPPHATGVVRSRLPRMLRKLIQEKMTESSRLQRDNPRPASRQRVVVVGAGVGGLACAAELGAEGYEVTLLEKEPQVGGKLSEISIGDSRVASGPTVLTMPWIFEDLFSKAGEHLSDFITLKPLDTLARHFWPDGTELSLYSSRSRSHEAIASVFGKREADAFDRFCTYAEQIYEEIAPVFLQTQRPTMGTVLRLRGLGAASSLRRVDVHRTMWKSLQSFFQEDKLVQLFGRYATYCGSSPFAAPGTYNLIAHVEQMQVAAVEGGIVRLAEALEQLCEKVNVRIRTRAEATQVEVAGGRVTGVKVAKEETLPADAVVLNCDEQAMTQGLLGLPLSRAAGSSKVREPSLSAVTWAGRGRMTGKDIAVHNVFFSDGNYEDEFSSVFDRGTVCSSPTVYMCAEDRLQKDQSEDERLFLLINAPPVDKSKGARLLPTVDELRDRMISTLRSTGLDLTLGEYRVTTPEDFARRFPGTGGALYGVAAHRWDAAFSRSAATTRLCNLYLAGGSVHPGPGLPLAATSGRLAAQALMKAGT